jgi:hypothetical protein
MRRTAYISNTKGIKSPQTHYLTGICTNYKIDLGNSFRVHVFNRL